LTFQQQQAGDHEALTRQLAAEETAWAAARVAAEIKRDEAIFAATTVLKGYEPEAAAREKAAAEAREQGDRGCRKAVRASR
jgi:hypothetical protein